MPAKKVLTSEEQKLFNEMKKLAKRANQRILRLEREFGSDTRATTLLREKLEIEPIQAWTSKGRVAVKKSMTVTQMKATIKATEQFLGNKMSTKKGIKQAKAKAIKTISEKFKRNITDISDSDIDILSRFFEDNDVNGVTAYIPGSSVLALVEEAKESSPVDYKAFYNKAMAIVEYNKGKKHKGKKHKGKKLDAILIDIFKKYIFNKQLIIENIKSARTTDDIADIRSLIDSLYNESVITNAVYNQLNEEIDNKEQEIT